VAASAFKRKDRAPQEVVVASLGGSEARVLQAARRGGEVVFQRWGAAPLAPGEEARALLQALSQAGIPERRVVLCLPARSVVMRRVQLPPAAPEQLPQLVAFEAQRHLPLPLGELASGYHELGPVDGATPGTEVLLAVARREDLARLERALASCGIRVEGYGIEALAVADAYLPGAPPAANGDARLLLAPEESGIHAQVLRDGRLLFSRFVPYNGGDWSAELRRSLTAYSVEHAESPIGEVVLLGKGDADQVSRAVGLPVVQSASGEGGVPPEHASLAGLARQALGAGHYPLRLPPQARPDGTRSQSRYRAAALAVAAFALAAAFTAWQLDQARTRSLEGAEAARLARQTERDRKLLDGLLVQRDALREQLREMGGGGAPPVPPLELLRRVAAMAPPGVWLTELGYVQGKPLQLEGTTRDAAQANRFLQSLERVPEFRGVELGYLRSAAVQDTPVTHFRIDCTLAEQAPAENAAVREVQR
jgi:hypothetical protein